ncbi:unnamed protein product [Didymodactylos carnosus]|uniref:Uncharacterized protein n=1 Tax=Didymodactylos carnosus TaxID=1234261 RepID=A0A813X5U8_9BILA|nr:unnamed protein product [Didymodactylos carnosus]CAF0865696.1 unnamed protein product [Didymodactylos carnosus]CAF3571382.1 unnamed protein product [Didymodactylos carnosus]CAF3653195.1 unnamed protein product [Didymodactylos carnosus]
MVKNIFTEDLIRIQNWFCSRKKSMNSDLHTKQHTLIIQESSNTEQDSESKSSTLSQSVSPLSTTISHVGAIRINDNGRRMKFDGKKWQALCGMINCEKRQQKSGLCCMHFKEQKDTFKIILEKYVPDVKNIAQEIGKNNSHNGNKTSKVKSPTPKLGDIKTSLKSNRRYIFDGTKFQPICSKEGCVKREKSNRLCATHSNEIQQHHGNNLLITNDLDHELMRNESFLLSSPIAIPIPTSKVDKSRICNESNRYSVIRKQLESSYGKDRYDKYEKPYQLYDKDFNEQRDQQNLKRHHDDDEGDGEPERNFELMEVSSSMTTSLNVLKRPDGNCQQPTSPCERASFTQCPHCQRFLCLAHLVEHQNLMKQKRDQLFVQASDIHSLLASLKFDNEKYEQQLQMENEKWKEVEIARILQQYNDKKQKITLESQKVAEKFVENQKELVQHYAYTISTKIQELSKQIDLYPYEIDDFNSNLTSFDGSVQELKKLAKQDKRLNIDSNDVIHIVTVSD